MNITIILEVIISAIIIATFVTPLLDAPAMAVGPSGKCYVDCTGGGIPSNVREHNICLTACIFGEGVQPIDFNVLPLSPEPTDRAKGQQRGRK